MGNIFDGGFTNSKIASRKIISDDTGNLNIDAPGNHSKAASLKSNTKAAVNPTTIPGPAYGMSNKGGASGDKDVGYPGAGAGVAELGGAHGNNAKRKLAFGN